MDSQSLQFTYPSEAITAIETNDPSSSQLFKHFQHLSRQSCTHINNHLMHHLQFISKLQVMMLFCCRGWMLSAGCQWWMFTKLTLLTQTYQFFVSNTQVTVHHLDILHIQL